MNRTGSPVEPLTRRNSVNVRAAGMGRYSGAVARPLRRTPIMGPAPVWARALWPVASVSPATPRVARSSALLAGKEGANLRDELRRNGHEGDVLGFTGRLDV